MTQDDIDLSWGDTEEYEVTYADGTTDLLSTAGKLPALLQPLTSGRCHG